MANYVISEILKSRKITDYLSSKGHQPIGSVSNGKLRYRCPLHKGDNTPSFIVYLNGEHENFFCYGCKARYHIIHLYRDLERVSTKEAIKSLANGLELDVDAEISHAIREINEDRALADNFNIVDSSLVLHRAIYSFVKEVNFESSCIQSADKMFELIDKAIDTGDVSALQNMDEPLTEAIVQKIMWYRDLEEKRAFEIERRRSMSAEMD